MILFWDNGKGIMYILLVFSFAAFGKAPEMQLFPNQIRYWMFLLYGRNFTCRQYSAAIKSARSNLYVIYTKSLKVGRPVVLFLSLVHSF